MQNWKIAKSKNENIVNIFLWVNIMELIEPNMSLYDAYLECIAHDIIEYVDKGFEK